VCVNHKMSTTAAASNKQGDVELVNFGLNGSNNLVIDVSTTLVTAQLTTDTSTARCKPISRTISRKRFLVKIRRYHAGYAVVGTAFAPALMSVAGQTHHDPEFLRLLWVLADNQTRNYHALIGVEEEIVVEAFGTHFQL